MNLKSNSQKIMQKKEIKISLEDFPTPLHCLLKNAKIYDSSCSTEMRVLYSDLGYYVKIAEKDRLKNEAKMAGLFAEKKLGPRLVSYLSTDKDYMVTESAVGEDALHYLDKPERLCEALCDAMKILHSTPISGIPISPCMDIYTSEKHGILLKQDTFIHGDFCLPNVILNEGKFASFIDLGGAGVGDRHIDMFWLLWSLNYNLGTNKYDDYVLDMYGRDKIDEKALKFVAEIENAR